MQRATNTEPIVEIDTTDPTVRWRYTCPYEHRKYEPTNGGIWCRYCELDDEIENAHHKAVLDTRENVLIDFDRVVLLEGEKRWA